MKLWNRSSSLIVLLSASVLFFGCEKEKIDNSDQGYPIELTLSKPGRNVILEWTQTNISDFESYMLVRSTAPIEDLPEPVGAFEIIDDFETNTFEDLSFPLAEEVFYKVYVKVGDRFLFSPTVSIQFEVSLLDIRTSRVVYDAESDLMFLYDNNQQTLHRYDLEAGEVTSTFSEPGVFDYVMDVGNMGLGTELLLCPNGGSIVEIYDDEFNFKQSFSSFSTVTDLDHAPGTILVSRSSSPSIEVVERSSLSTLEEISNSSAFERRIKVLPSADRRVVEVSFDGISSYRFDSNWNQNSASFEFIFTNPLNEIVASPSGEFFIPNQEGQIYDSDLNLIGEATLPNLQFSQEFLFSKDESKVYTFRSSPGEIIELSFPELEELRVIPLNYFPVKAYLKLDGQLVIVGRVFTTFPEMTFVDVLDLE